MRALMGSEGSSEIAGNPLMRSAKSKPGTRSPHFPRAGAPGSTPSSSAARFLRQPQCGPMPDQLLE
jgi:hypothetical protein